MSSGPAGVVTIVGVPHDGSSLRSVFHTVSPVSALSASENESACVSHCTMTRPFQTIELVPVPTRTQECRAPHINAAEIDRPSQAAVEILVGMTPLPANRDDDASIGGGRCAHAWI